MKFGTLSGTVGQQVGVSGCGKTRAKCRLEVFNVVVVVGHREILKTFPLAIVKITPNRVICRDAKRLGFLKFCRLKVGKIANFYD